MAIIFASLLALGRSFSREVERGSLDGLLASPIDPGALYLAKVSANVILLVVLEAVIIPLAAILFNLQIFQPTLLLTLLLGNIGIASVGDDSVRNQRALPGSRGAAADHAAAPACAGHHRGRARDGAGHRQRTMGRHSTLAGHPGGI